MNGNLVLSLNVSLSVHRYSPEPVVVMILPSSLDTQCISSNRAISSCFTKHNIPKSRNFQMFPAPSCDHHTFAQLPQAVLAVWKMRLLGLSPGLMSPMMPHWEGSRAAVLLGWPKSHPLSPVIGIFQGDIMRPGYCLALSQTSTHQPGPAGASKLSQPRGVPKVTVSIIPSTLASRFSPEKRASLLPYLFSIATDSQITDLFSVYQCFFRKLMVFRNQDSGSLLLGLWWLTGSLRGRTGKTGWAWHMCEDAYNIAPLGILHTHTNQQAMTSIPLSTS